MKRLLSFFLLMVAITLPSIAQGSTGNSSSKRVKLEIRQTKETPTHMHRAPMFVDIEAYYNEEEGTLEICYDGDATGETFLYLNGNVVGYDSEINTSFQISTPGLYKIEVISESWVATGYIEL